MSLAQSRWRFDRMVGAPLNSRFGLASSVDGCSARRFAGRRRDRWRDRRGLVAAELAEAGRRVVLVERAAIASAASGRNSGVVQHPFDPVLIDLHLATVARYRALAEASGGTFVIGAEPAGMLFVSHDTETVRRIAVELRRSHPGLRRDRPSNLVVHARSSPPWGPTWPPAGSRSAIRSSPPRPTRAYADLAVTRGVEIRLGSGAAPDLDAGRVVGARLGDGTCIAASDVVVAAGPWSPSLVDPSGRWRPIRPRLGCGRVDDACRHRRAMCWRRRRSTSSLRTTVPGARGGTVDRHRAIGLQPRPGRSVQLRSARRSSTPTSPPIRPRGCRGSSAMGRDSCGGSRPGSWDRRASARARSVPTAGRSSAACRGSTGCGSSPVTARGGSRPGRARRPCWRT